MFSVKGDTVLDPFAGTGTTMKIARELERNSMGYEIDNELANFIVQKFGQKTLESDFEVIRRL